MGMTDCFSAPGPDSTTDRTDTDRFDGAHSLIKTCVLCGVGVRNSGAPSTIDRNGSSSGEERRQIGFDLVRWRVQILCSRVRIAASHEHHQRRSPLPKSEIAERIKRIPVLFLPRTGTQLLHVLFVGVVIVVFAAKPVGEPASLP